MLPVFITLPHQHGICLLPFNNAAFMGSLTIFNMAAAATNSGNIGGLISAVAAGLTGYSAIRSFAEGLKQPVTPAALRP